VVAGRRVYVLAKVPDREAEVLLAFDAETGWELWKSSYDRAPFKSAFGNGPRATPVVVNGKVYSMGATGIVRCAEAATGKLVWKVDTTREFHAPQLFFGASCSPLVVDGRVLLNVGGKESAIVALDGRTGKTMWKAMDDGAGYSSPIAVETGETKQVVFLTPKAITSIDPMRGAPLWRYAFADLLGEASATPVFAHGLVVGSTITLGAAAIKPPANTGEPQVVWKNQELTSYFSTPVSVNDQLYMITGTKPPAISVEATLHCVDLAIGKSLWKESRVGKYHASLLRSGNDRLLLLSDSGRLALLAPNAHRYRELCSAKVCGETWAHPALSGGRLYVRDADSLICLELDTNEIRTGH
jgi:outer membrane protein assembly factor BamB